MDWKTLVTDQRLRETKSTKTVNDVRSEFERDVDRIIYAGAFRRLSRKTQVHPLAPNDHVHNRLTHSLETSRVGRGLAIAVHRAMKNEFGDVPEVDVAATVQAACAAHDIGNPPFGHGGEEAMVAALKKHDGILGAIVNDDERRDITSFEGNAQGFRILTQTENYLFDGGLRLTYATLGAFLKYPHLSTVGEKKFSVFLSESELLHEVAGVLGLPRQGNGYARHPLAYLVEAADDICYCVLDLEDGVELGLVAFDRVLELIMKTLSEDAKKDVEARLGDRKMFRVNFTRIRGTLFAALIEGAVEGFRMKYDEIMRGQRIEHSENGMVRRSSLFDILGAVDPRGAFIVESKALAAKDIYTDGKKVEVEIGAFATLDTLLTELCTAAIDTADCMQSNQQPSWKSKRILRLMGDHEPTATNSPGKPWTPYLCCRRAIDFVSGSTDNYATYLGKQLRGDGFTGVQRP